MKPYPKIDTVFERDTATHKVRVEAIKSPAIRNVKLWDATEKLDGTNMRVTFTAGIPKYTPPPIEVQGRSDKAQLHPELVESIREWATHAAFEAFFVANQYLAPAESVTLYGEGVGPGIQKVGDRYGDAKHFVLFDVLYAQNDTRYLDDDQIDEVAKALGCARAPRIGSITLDEAVAEVRAGFESVHGTGPAEGLILRPHREPLYDRRGRRVIAKIKTVDF